MTTPLLIALLAFVLLVVAVGWSAVSPSVARTGVVVALAIGWLLVNKPVEGPVILTFTENRGLTASDLLSALCASLSIAAVVRRGSQRTHQDEDGQTDRDSSGSPAGSWYDDEGKGTQGSASWRRERD